MAQNAYPSDINNKTNTNSIAAAAQGHKKRVHHLDDPATRPDANRNERYDPKAKEEKEELPFYPAFCFPASPTHFTWVKMSIANIHRLQSRRGFEGQNIYFHKNHPIQFVCLAGYILTRDEYERRTVLTVDDSSGSILEVICLKAPIKDNPSSTGVATATEASNITSTTREPINTSSLQIGTCIKLKGTLSPKYRTATPAMTVILERFWHLTETNSEVRFWNERTKVWNDILSQPWRLSADEVEALRHEALAQENKVLRNRLREQDRLKRVQEREERSYRRIMRRWEAEEKVRQAEEERVRLDNTRLEKWLALKREPRKPA